MRSPMKDPHGEELNSADSHMSELGNNLALLTDSLMLHGPHEKP